MRVIIKILAICSFCSVAHFSDGQKIVLSALKKADNAFEHYGYAEAVNLYKAALKKSGDELYITRQIATCFKNLNLSDSSAIWFQKAVDLGDHGDSYFHLAEALLMNGERAKSRYWYEQYAINSDQDLRGLKRLAALEQYDEFNRPNDRFEVDLLKASSPGLDFSPAFTEDGILFVSSRPKNQWVGTEFNWDQSNFLDIYHVRENSDDATYYDKGINTKYHEGPLQFYQNNQAIAFTRNNSNGRKLRKDKDGISKLKLYFAEIEKKTQQLINITSFPFNSDDYSISAPALNNEGDILIFSSDKPGGFGASDLYISHKRTGTWSEPQNLGPAVNTNGREGFAFLHDNELYFASDGHSGLGGLDIYKINFDGEKVNGRIENMGAPINSNRDDFGLILKDHHGYFSSNRGLSTLDDIYKFTEMPPSDLFVSGRVLDKETKEPIALADVFLNSDSNERYTRTDATGTYLVKIPKHLSWKITASKFGYDDDEGPIGLTSNEGDTIKAQDILLQRMMEQEDTSVAAIVYYDFDSYELNSKYIDQINEILASQTEISYILLDSHTDVRGTDNYNNQLSTDRSLAVFKYLISAGVDTNKINFMNHGENLPVVSCPENTNCSQQDHQLNRRTEIRVVTASR